MNDHIRDDGEPLDRGMDASPVTPDGTGAAWDAPEGVQPTADRFPWPPGEGEPVIDAYVRTWQGASLRPGSFFATMPARGSLGAAILYYLTIGIAVSGATLFWNLSGLNLSPAREATLGETATSPLIDFLFAPVMLLLSLFIAAGIVHVMLKMVGGATRDFLFTARLFCFAYSPQILGVIPVVGVIVGFVWMVVVAIAGLRAGHGTTTGRAAVAVLVPVTVGLIFVGIAWFVVRTAGFLQMPL